MRSAISGDTGSDESRCSELGRTVDFLRNDAAAVLDVDKAIAVQTMGTWLAFFSLYR